MLSADVPDDDPLISAERAHLAHARDCLRRMRERTESLDAIGGDPLSTEYLKAALYHRARALADDPSTPLFFGRLDYDEPIERFHIGRRHVHDEAGDPVVIDWRAGIARPFYRATVRDPMGLGLRRRFGFSGGTLTAYEDETFRAGEEDRTSAILTEEIERPRTGPMRDIVATIQPDQDEIVRADLGQTICVQGAPGTGKTAVGLHRAAYLLYAHRERLRRGGVMVIGPNRSFLSYIEQVLPALGEVNISQVTVNELVAHVPVHGEDSPAVATLKGDPRMARVLRRAVRSTVGEPTEGLVLTRGSRRWRLSLPRLIGLVDDLKAREVRYGAARAMLPKLVAGAIIAAMEESGDAPDDRVFAAVASAPPVKRFVNAAWPALDPVKVAFGLLSSPAILAAAADGILTYDEQRLLLWQSPPRSPRSAHWSVADSVLIDEASDLIERTATVGHIIVDEAQDLSPMQCRAIGRRCETGSATVLGDIAQGTAAWATESWDATLAHLGKEQATLETLDRGYRVPRQIIDYGSRLLPHIAPDIAPPTSIREAAGALLVRSVPTAELAYEALNAARSALAWEGSVGMVAAESTIALLERTLGDASLPHRLLGAEPDTPSTEGATRLSLVPATLAKGLEFDHVIVVEPAEIVAGEPRGLRRLYVVLTRAVSRLTVVHAAPLPDALTSVQPATAAP